MDFSQNYYDNMYPQMGYGQRMPFYMTYPMQDPFLQEAEYERDRMHLQELYPKEAKEVIGYVKDACDRMEYDGSMMFDVYPDRLMLRRLCRDIYQKMTGKEVLPKGSELEADSLFPLIQVLLYHEIYQRRCRYRRCRRWY